MTRESQLVRALRLLRLLGRTGGATLDELADELGVVRRTVYRDLEALEDAGAPLHADADTWPRRWHVLPGFLDRGGLRVGSQELVALTTLARLQRGGDGTFARTLEALAWKLRSLVPQPILEEADRQLARTAVPPWPQSAGSGARLSLVDDNPPSETTRTGGSALEDRLQRAIEGGEELRLEYRSRSQRGRGERIVRPLGLALRPSGSYLLAWDVAEAPWPRDPAPFEASASGGGLRRYKLARIEDLEPTGECFEPPEGFEADSVFAGSFGVRFEEPSHVRVRFSPAAADFVRERRWHPSQELVPQADGGVVLSLTVGGLVEVKAWVQGFGADAEVLEPEALAEEVAADARRVARRWARAKRSRAVGRSASGRTKS